MFAATRIAFCAAEFRTPLSGTTVAFQPRAGPLFPPAEPATQPSRGVSDGRRYPGQVVSVVHAFDPLSQEFLADPYAELDRVRDQGGVLLTSAGPVGGHRLRGDRAGAVGPVGVLAAEAQRTL